MRRINERIKFRLLRMECCGQLICWVNPRLPTYCPECSKACYPNVRSWVVHLDDNASIGYTASEPVKLSEETRITNEDALRTALEKSVQLQGHYAGLLNSWDGGKRTVFKTAQEWLARLKAMGVL